MDFEDEQLKAVLATMLPRDRLILEMRAQGVSLETIAATFKCSRATASRWASQAQQKLNGKLKAAARAGKWRSVLARRNSGADVAEPNQADRTGENETD